MSVMFSEIAWPTTRSYWLADARVPACLLADTAALGAPDGEGVVRADLLVGEGKIARIEKPVGARNDGIARVDLGGRQVWPTLVDIHTHLDKGHTVARSPNPDGTVQNARLAAAADRPNWTAADLRRRVEFGLRCAHVYGVTAIRSHT